MRDALYFIAPIVAVGWGYLLVTIALGVIVGAAVPAFRGKLILSLAVIVVPPLALVALYAMASSTGCSGGDCIGAMLLIGLLGIAAAFASLLGMGLTIGTLIRMLVRLAPSDRSGAGA